MGSRLNASYPLVEPLELAKAAARVLRSGAPRWPSLPSAYAELLAPSCIKHSGKRGHGWIFWPFFRRELLQTTYSKRMSR